MAFFVKEDIMSLIEAKNVIFEYIRRDKDGNVEGINRAVDDVSLSVEQGDFVAILGHNGSGKSTLAKHLNAILYPTEGVIYVDGKDTPMMRCYGILDRQLVWYSRILIIRLLAL